MYSYHALLLPGKTNIVRILSDDEQIETLTVEDSPEVPPSISTPGQPLTKQLQNCGEVREHFLRRSKKQSFFHSKLCHFLFIVFRKSYGLPLYTGDDKSSIGGTKSAKSTKTKSLAPSETVIYLTGSSRKPVSKETDTQTSTFSSTSTSVIETASETGKMRDKEQAPREVTSQATKADVKVLKSESSPDSMTSPSIQPTSTTDDILQTTIPQTVLSTSTMETPSKTSAACETETASIESVISDHIIDTMIDEGSKISVTTNQEVTSSLPVSWKPDTKDLMEASTVAGKQENKKMEDTDTPDKVSLLLLSCAILLTVCLSVCQNFSAAVTNVHRNTLSIAPLDDIFTMVYT